jgi:hypothetical protein
MDGTRVTNVETNRRRPARRWLCRLLLLACAGLAVVLPACTQDGHFTVLGYTTAPNYDCNIHTVRVPIFDNRTFRRGLEFQLTEAVVREIHAKTPYRVVGADQPADTELRGTIVAATKGILNLNQLAETREAETAVTVELTWIDLRSGQVLSKPGRRFGQPGEPEPMFAPGISNTVPGFTPPLVTGATAPLGPDLASGDGTPPPPPPLGAPPPKPPPIRLRTVDGFIPELGGSITTGFQKAIDKMAIQIVSMMEKPW